MVMLLRLREAADGHVASAAASAGAQSSAGQLAHRLLQRPRVGRRYRSFVETGVSVLEKKPSRVGGRALLVVLFVVYLVLLAWLVLWKLEVPYVGAGALRVIKLGIFIASPLRFAPPRDVAVVSTYSVPVQDSGTQTSANTPD
jgi:hypothetical protein